MSKSSISKWKARTPLSSFDKRYHNVLLEAATTTVQLTFATTAAAKAFQSRLQLYRARYREEFGEDEAAILYRSKTSRKDNILTIGPADRQFNSILSQFNTPTQPPPDLPAVGPTETPIPTTEDENPSDLEPIENLSLEDLFKSIV